MYNVYWLFVKLGYVYGVCKAWLCLWCLEGYIFPFFHMYGRGPCKGL